MNLSQLSSTSVNTNLPIGLFGNVLTTSRTSIIQLKSSHGITQLRDVISSGGGGYVAHSGASLGGEFEFGTTTNSTGWVVMQSAERGRYQPGYSAECGIGFRLSETGVTGSNIVRFGYYDTGDGFYFQFSSGDMFCGLRKGGVDTLVSRSNWLYGNNLSQYSEFNPQKGYIYQIDFGWYGYSTIEYQIQNYDTGNTQKLLRLHNARVTGASSTNEPNLPIRVEINNNGSSVPVKAYVAGRQFSILGEYDPVFRQSSQLVENKTVGTEWTPLISFRHKDNYKAVECRPDSYAIINGSNPITLKFLINSTLIGPTSWGALSGILPSETALEKDIGATGISNGIQVFETLHAANTNQTRTLSEAELDGIIFPEYFPLTIAARSLTATSTVNILCRLREEW